MSCYNYQETNPCQSRNRCSCCYTVAAAFLGLLLAFALGMIIGAVAFRIILPALAALIAFTAAIAAAVIAVLIYCRCRRSE